jgi:hypothetical protein
VLRVTLTRSAVGNGWFNARSWTLVQAVDWVDCDGRVYFIARYPDWRTVLSLPAEDVALLSLPAEDVAFVDEILTGL